MSEGLSDSPQWRRLPGGWKLTQEHEHGVITACRHARDCGAGNLYTKAENRARNLSLVAKVRTGVHGVGVAAVRGIFIENHGSPEAREVDVEAFLVVDIKDKGNLRDILVRLGEEFDQDCILFAHAGRHPVLVGTSQCPGSWPGYGEVRRLDGHLFDEEDRICSRLDGCPFVFECFETGVSVKHFPSEMMGACVCSRMHWSELVDA